MSAQQLMYDLSKASELTTLSVRFLQGEIYRGRLRSVKSGRRRLVTDAQLRDYIELLERENAPQLAVVPSRRAASG